MGKSSQASPDYAGMYAANMQLAASQSAIDLGKKQLAQQQAQFDAEKPLIDRVTTASADAQEQANKFAADNQAFYQGTVQPAAQKYIQAAQNYDTPATEQQNAGEAQSSVASQFNQARTAAQQQLESFGIDPSSTRYAALDIGTRSQQAAAAAGAGTSAIQTTRNTGLGLQQSAVALGMGIPNTVNSGLATGSAAGQSAAGAATGYNAAAAAGPGTGNSLIGGGLGGLGGAGSGLTNAYSAYNNANYQAQQQSSGLGSLLGLGASLLSSPAGAGMMAAFADGGAIPDPNAAPPYATPPNATPGGAIPMQASPSAGQATDDVPARLTAGEFVVPKDVMEWLGQKQLYGMLDKARADRDKALATTQAKPQMGPAIPSPPSFVSRPGAPSPGIPMRQVA